MQKKLKIVSISSEVAPFSKTGGLADVARSLPKALKRLGHEVIIITPLYSKAIDKKAYKLKLLFEGVKMYLNSEDCEIFNVWQGYLMEELPVYFIENKKYFSKHKNLYGSSHENARFMVFNVAALKLISLLKFQADIVHCHDWQSGLIPHYLKNDFRYSKTLSNARTVFTIHNLIFQFGHNWWEVPVSDRDYGRSAIPHLDNPKLETINFAKRAILSADIINTVSEQYREEIMTKKFGQDLHRILKNREDRLLGIINGIDYNAYNPEKDSGLKANYSWQDFMASKRINKKFLQAKLNLPVDEDIPMLCTTSRITFQKGFHLLFNIADALMKQDLQLVIMGDGGKDYLAIIKKLRKKYPKKIAWIPFTGNSQLETSFYAASDFFLLPSTHEPCGINQLIAMRYGCIPIVREIGGLYDTVSDYDPATGRGAGFTFRYEDSFQFFAAVVRALETFRYTKNMEALVRRAMKQSNSWEIPAKKYVKLYRRALRLKI
jgi:starch synthase